MANATPRVFEFEVSVDREREARSALGGDPIPRDEHWWAEHLVLAGLVRCTLASLDHAAGRAGVQVAGSGRARGVVTRREEDGRYALVDVEVQLDVALDPPQERAAVDELVARAERGCFVGNSLAASPRYRWIVDGSELA